MDLAVVLADWTSQPGPLHQKLTSALRQAVLDGDVPIGTRLPAERTLASTLAVSRSTVVAAYDRLRSEGLLASRQGSGTFVAAGLRRPPPDGGVRAGQGQTIFARLVHGPTDVLSLACAIVPSCHPAVTQAIVSLAHDDLAPVLGQAGYLPLGLPVLRQALAALHTREDLPTSADQILVTTGAQQALNLTAALLVKPGDAVVVESPGFPSVLDAFRARGARLVTVGVDDEGADVDHLEQVARRGPVAAVFVMPSFHNPTGVAMSEGRRRRLAALADDLDLPVVEDNALEHARLGLVPPPPIARFGRDVLTIGSLSKVLWGGLRVGWLRGPTQVVTRLGKLKAMHDLGTGLLDQLVAARLVPDFARFRAERETELVARLEHMELLLRRHLPDWSWRRPAGGGSLWVHVPGADTAVLAQVGLRHGVEIVPGTTMSPDGSHRDHLRVPFTYEPDEAATLVGRLADAWEAYRGMGQLRSAPATLVV